MTKTCDTCLHSHIELKISKMNKKRWNIMNKKWSRVKKKVKINPCPLCGSRKIYLVSTTISLLQKHNLECFEDGCHCCGPHGLTMRTAVWKWNRYNGGTD